MLTTYGAALGFVLASVVTGQAAGALLGRRGWWAAGPAAGLAVLLCVVALATRLPEREVLAPVALGLVLAAALAVLVRARGRLALERSGAAERAAVLALALLAAGLPFYVNGRAGLLGVSLNNDTAAHLVWAEGLRSRGMAFLYPLPGGYPLAPHGLMAALASATGIAMDEVLNGLLIAVPALTAMTALGVLRGLPGPVRVAGAVLVAFAYLAAAYYGQGAFKETLMALFLLAFAVVLGEGRAEGERAWARGAVAGLLAAGAVQVYSYLALGWFAAVAVAWLAAELALRRRERAHWRAAARELARPVGIAVAVLVVLVIAQADRVLSFVDVFGLSPAGTETGIGVGATGNLAGPLSPYEALGAWPSPDFRFSPANAFRAGQLGTVALAVALLGAVTALRRREPALVAAAVVGMAVWWVADRSQSPYVAAKALAIAAPVVMALALAALPRRPWGWRPGIVVPVAVVALFAASAAWSSSLVLRGSPVASGAAEAELGALRPVVGDRPTLFLGNDHHASWWLRDVYLGTVSTGTVRTHLPAPLRPEKPRAPGQGFDFDSLAGAALDRYAYVVTPRSGYDSEPPQNFTRIREGRLFELWERRGPTPARMTLEPSGAPGAPLGCDERRRGTARVWPARPRAVPGGPPIAPGAAADLALPLTPGRWRLSLQYTSTAPVRIVSEGQTWTLPPNTAQLGSYFDVGEIDVAAPGPRGFRVVAEQSARIGSRGAGTIVGALAATAPQPGEDRPLARSCGRYVDWFRAG